MRAPVWPTRLRRDDGGLALVEFAITLPVLLLLGLSGAEFANYITTKMRISQIALQIADNAARMGSSTQSGMKTISETDINDVFIGGQLEADKLDLKTNGRVILSDLEPIANPNKNAKYRIRWQRCSGGKTGHGSLYGKTGDTNLPGIGPKNALVTAQDYSATMFVEVYYEYKPLFTSSIVPGTMLDEFASMAVRDQRQLDDKDGNPAIYNAENATPSNC